MLGRNITKWENVYKWAIYSVSNKGWFCKTCQQFSSYGDEFWKTKSVKHGEHPGSTFTSHVNSEKHKKAVETEVLVKSVLSKGDILKQQIHLANEAKQISEAEQNRKLLKKFFKVTYFSAKKNRAVKNNFQDEIEFLKDLGDEDISRHLAKSAKNATYTSHYIVDQYIKIISEHFEKKTLEDVCTAIDFTILADESTDEADRSQLAIFVRYVDMTDNLPVEKYLGLVKLGASKTAEALQKEIETFLEKVGLDIKNVRFAGLDGTNAMSGERRGLQRRLRHLSPFCIYLNCTNHRLALVLVHLMKMGEFDTLVSLDKLLLSIWKFFEYSSIKQAVFDDAQKVLEQKPLKILKACTTRWLTHGETCNRVISRYEPLVNALDTIYYERRDPESKGIRDLLLDS